MHCDVKSQNILFDEVDGMYNLCITDFGVSQVQLKSEKVHMRRNIQLPAMSIAYAAPEILSGLQ